MRQRQKSSGAARFFDGRLVAGAVVLLFAAALEAESPPVRLVLFLSIDQARGDYLERFRPALTGGLRMLLDRGVVFTNLHQNHATTVTGAGHASLATGLHPSRSGIVGNNWYDRSERRWVYCVEDRDSPVLAPPGPGAVPRTTSGRSPVKLLGTGLGDWMKEKMPESRVYSVGAKDRSAVLLAGKRPDGAFWFDPGSGQWVTSRYYLDRYPSWVMELHARRAADAWFGATWEPLPLAADVLAAMEIEASGPGAEDSGIPRLLGRAGLFPGPELYEALLASPFIESHLLDFAETLVVKEGLGGDEVTDLLALSFASVDYVGHAHGPNSRELLDAVMRLDRELGEFFRFLDGAVGLSRIAVVLSSDHGVAALPEYRLARGFPAARLSSEDFQCFQRAGRAFQRSFGSADWLAAPMYFDYEILSIRGVARERAEEVLASELARCRAVARVWTRSEIEKARSGEGLLDATLALYVRGFHPERSPDLFVQLEKWHVDRRRGTTHGSPYDYDTHVPGIVLWPGAAPRRVGDRTATVDLPVTLAALLGVETPKGLDGVDRFAIMR